MNEKLAFIFPGSGSQYAGMARADYADSAVVRKTFEEADCYLDCGFSKIILEGGTVKLGRMSNMLLAIYIVSVAYFRLYMEEIGEFPAYMAGHSLGEYSALTCSAMISFENCLKIVKLRSKLAEDVANSAGGAMTIVKNVTPSLVDKICSGVSRDGHIVSVSCFNSPTQVSISGNDMALQEVEQRILELESHAQIINLVGSAPYHCIMMQPSSGILEAELEKCSWFESKCQVISNVTGLPYRSSQEVRQCLKRQLYQPVQWEKSIGYLLEKGVDTIVEIGPRNVLENLIDEISSKPRVYAYDNKLEREELSSALKKRTIFDNDREMKLKAIEMCISYATPLICSNGASEGRCSKSRSIYEEVRGIRDAIVKNRLMVWEEYVEKAFEMLASVFEAKAVPGSERQARIDEILDRTGLYAMFIEMLGKGYSVSGVGSLTL